MADWNYDNDQWRKLRPHIRHLPLFTRNFDFTSWLFRLLWAAFLKIAFRFYVKLRVNGDFDKLYAEHPRLLLISNHASHLDAVSIAAGIPFRYWLDLYISAAKDYWFRNPIFTFFSKHCLGAIPIDRKDKGGEAIKLCISLLENLDRCWMILFPEGTRSKDGRIQTFKRGVSRFAESTNTPILFLYLEGNNELWPKGRLIPLPGELVLHVGPVHPPAGIEEIYTHYKDWVLTINPNAYAADTTEPADEVQMAPSDQEEENET